MEENYINIYCRFLDQEFKGKSITGKDMALLMQKYEPFLDIVKNRQDLINFLEKNLQEYPVLEKLIVLLKDQAHVFPAPEESLKI